MKAYKTSQGSWQLNFSENGVQKTLYFGKRFDSVSADRVARIITEMLESRHRGDTVPLELLRKVSNLPKRIQSSMERLGLISVVSGLTLQEFFERFSETKSELKSKTQKFYRDWYKRFYNYFGESARVSSITDAAASKFFDCCEDNLSACTVYRGLVGCRTIFDYAVKLRLLTENPFKALSYGERSNESRQYYVTREMLVKVLSNCNDDYERLVIVLARFAGLRIPSEIRNLRFRDIGNKIIRIDDDTKTGSREVPLFREVREVFEHLSGASDDFIFTGNLSKAWYPWQVLADAIERSGLERWPKLFVNLRSSCITDLDKLGYSEKTLDAIFGNSAEVRRIHYLQLQKELAYAKVLSDNEALQNDKFVTGVGIEKLKSYTNILALRDLLVSEFGTGLEL
jgi:integrase